MVDDTDALEAVLMPAWAGGASAAVGAYAVGMTTRVTVSQPSQPCSKGDAQIIANAGIQAVQQRSGVVHGPGSSYQDCQFRFYDDNDDEGAPEVPHVFTDKDYFIGAIALFEFYDSFQRPAYDRAGAITYLNTISTRVFFGPASMPDAALPELALTNTKYRDGVFIGDGIHAVIGYRYMIFTPGSLAPGEYKWRFEAKDLVVEDPPLHGTIIIVDE